MKKLLSVIISTFFLVGCSCFAPSKQKISIMTNVNEAEIFADGEFIGVGMASFNAQRNKNHEIMVKADGYYPVYKSIGNQLSTTAILDIIGIFIWIIPFIGLFTPGAKTLDTDNVSIRLVPAK